MRDFIKKLLSERSQYSSMRLMSILSLLVASALAFIGLHKGVDLGSLATLCGVFLGAGFVGKATQKFAENKQASQESKSVDNTDEP